MRFQVEALKATVAVLLIVGIGMSAQSPAAHPPFDRFEVATVKPTPPDWAGGRFIRMLNADQFVARNHALKTLIAAAYNLSPKEISGGPEWVDSDRYDILAKTPGEVRPDLDEQMSMLRELLADRFKLAFHREQKEMSIYTLTITKGGPKLKESAKTQDASPAGPPPLIFVLSPHSARLPGRDATMGELASVMQRALLDRPVLDRTGLTGRYDFDLEFMPDESQFGGRWASQGSRPIMTLRPASLRRFNNNSACNWKRQRGQLLRWLSIALNVHRLTDRAVFQTPAARRLVINNKTNRAEVSPTFLSSAVSQ